MSSKLNFFTREEQSKFIHRVYQETPHLIRNYFNEELSWLQEALAETRRVLEIGCGTGRAVSAIPATANYFGVDIGFPFVSEASAQYPDLAWFCGDAAKLPVLDSTLDAAFCIQNTIGNMEGMEESVIAEGLRILRKGGKLIVSVYSEDSVEIRRVWYDRLVDCGIFGRVWIDPSDPRVMRSDTGWSSRCFSRNHLEDLFAHSGTDLRIKKLDSFLYFAIATYRGSFPSET